MIVVFLAQAWAGPTGELNVRAGGRTAPEAALQTPDAWANDTEPSALLSVDGAVRLGAADGGWARFSLGAWGYLPDEDSLLATGSVSGGWTGPHTALAARYDVQAFPVLPDASNGRLDLLGRWHRKGTAWDVVGQVEAVDRRWWGESGFTAAEVSAVAGTTRGLFGVDLGAGGQGNLAGGLFTDGEPGAQARVLGRLRLGDAGWRLALEYRFIWAFSGEVEAETAPATTPMGEYADDLDALSGGGFLQHRVGLSGAVVAGPWTVAASGFFRQRTPEEADEGAVAFTRSYGGQGQLTRTLSTTVGVSGTVGATHAELGSGPGYLDAYGWLGLSLRFGKN